MPFTIYGKELIIKDESITQEMYEQIMQHEGELSKVELNDIDEKISGEDNEGISGQSIYYLDTILEEHPEVKSVEIYKCSLILSAATQINFIQTMRRIENLYLSAGNKNNGSNYLGIENYEKIIQDNKYLNSLDLWLDADEMSRLLPAINSCVNLNQLKIKGISENISMCCNALKGNQFIEELWIKDAKVDIDEAEAEALLDLVRNNQYIKCLNLSESCVLTIPAARIFINFLKAHPRVLFYYGGVGEDNDLTEKIVEELDFYINRNWFISKVSAELGRATRLLKEKQSGSIEQIFAHVDQALVHATDWNFSSKYLAESESQRRRCYLFRGKVYAEQGCVEKAAKDFINCFDNETYSDETCYELHNLILNDIYIDADSKIVFALGAIFNLYNDANPYSVTYKREFLNLCKSAVKDLQDLPSWQAILALDNAQQIKDQVFCARIKDFNDFLIYRSRKLECKISALHRESLNLKSELKGLQKRSSDSISLQALYEIDERESKKPKFEGRESGQTEEITSNNMFMCDQ